MQLAALKVSGLSVHDGALWLASIREQCVVRAALDAAVGERVVAFPHPVADVAPAPEGLWLVAGGGTEGRQCVLWSLAEGRVLHRFDCPGGAGGGLAFHRGRLWLTHRHNRRLHVIDPVSGGVEHSFTTEHEVFSPAVADGALWLVEARTGPFGRFSPSAESSYFFARLDADDGRTLERLAAPDVPAAMATDGARFWYAPRAGTGVAIAARAALAPA